MKIKLRKIDIHDEELFKVQHERFKDDGFNFAYMYDPNESFLKIISIPVSSTQWSDYLPSLEQSIPMEFTLMKRVFPCLQLTLLIM